MRMSKLFGRTWREAPAEAEVISHQLLLRAGLAQKLAAGIYSSLPLLQRSLLKVQRIIREEMDRIDGQEISMPVVQPAELWQESGRWQQIGPELARLQDRSGRDMVLGMTHEEVVTDLARRQINSYRQLPCMLYQIQTKFRDEPRARAGLIRVREFTMKDAYSFHADSADLDAYYQQVVDAYHRIFQRCGLKALQVLSDTGMMGGAGAHEFMLVTEIGEDTLLHCPSCGYAANQEVAEISRSRQRPVPEQQSPRSVHTPNQKDIGQVAGFLGVAASDVLKTVVYRTPAELLLVVIAGNLQVNERKLGKLLQTDNLRMASPEEAQAAGLVTGFVSPIGLPGLRVVADRSVEVGKGYVAGANRPDYHLLHAVPGRDFTIDLMADLALATGGQPCPVCGATLSECRGVELGNTFKLGTKYSAAMRAEFYDAAGVNHPLVMGCYGIGIGRLVACVLEAHHDQDGIVWPLAIAPYQVHLVTLGKDDETINASTDLYQRLTATGVETLWDDRDATAGVKFNDADLIGLPLRVLVGRRTLGEGMIEVKARNQPEKQLIPLASAVDYLRQACQP